LNQENSLSIAVSGTAWMGGGVSSVQFAIEELLTNAESEVLIAIYEITETNRGFIDLLRTCLARGIRVTLIINRYMDKSPIVRNKLETLKVKFPYFDIFDFRPERRAEDLHAKIMVVDRQHALVGSANLTWKGLVGNHELAVLVSGRTASKIGSLLDKLFRDSRTFKITGGGLGSA
jgi:phosphatidylserine/phosphatidylglycerophosphate/cardiolipin synthase-like enzyme